MQKYTNTVQNLAGDAIIGATVNVTTLAGAPVTTYSDEGITPLLAIVSDSHGLFSFYATNGTYNLAVSGKGITPYTINAITIFDPKDALFSLVDTVAGIYALNKQLVSYVTTKGFSAKGDNGGANYWYDPTDTTSADNGATVIVANDGGRWKLLFNNLFLNQVDSLAYVRNLNKRIVSYIETKGYSAKGDGGEGSYWYDATDTVSADNTVSVIVASDGGRWKLLKTNVLNVEQGGAKGDGTTDDTTAIQLVLNSLGTKGGTVWLNKAGRYRISNNLTIPAGVTLKGHFSIPGKVLPGGNSSPGLDSVGSSLLIAATATITLMDGSGISNVNMIRYGMAFPSADSSAFSGVALTVGGSDVYVGYSAICGFNLGIFSNGHERMNFEWLHMDNTTGIEITYCRDITRMSNIHMWPFAVFPNADATKFQRTGYGFNLHDVVDGPMLQNCFVIGYYRNYYFKNIGTPSVIGCSSDMTGVYTASAGYYFEGYILGGSILGSHSWTSDFGFYINTASNSSFISILDSDSNTHRYNGILIASGNVKIDGHFFNLCTEQISTTNADSLINIDNCIFDGPTGQCAIFSNVTTTNILVGNNNYSNTMADGTFLTNNAYIKTPVIASASTLTLPVNQDVIVVSGTTTFGIIAGGYSGRIITMIFAGAVLVQHNVTKIKLSGNVDFISAANSTLTLVNSNGVWYETGRCA
jgi:hypothetical protein